MCGITAVKYKHIIKKFSSRGKTTLTAANAKNFYKTFK